MRRIASVLVVCAWALVTTTTSAQPADEQEVVRLLLIDALSMTFREVRLKRNPDCPLCGDNPTVTELIDYEVFCGIAEPQEAAAVGSD